MREHECADDGSISAGCEPREVDGEILGSVNDVNVLTTS